MTEWVIGIDSGKDRVDAVGLMDGELMATFTVDLVKDVKKQTRSDALGKMRFMTGGWLRGFDDPHIFVEGAIVMRNAQTAVLLAETVGMLLSLPYQVTKVAIDQWKQVAAGKGGVNKDVVKAAIQQRYPDADAQFHGRQDLYDATGVAIYGYSVLRRGLPDSVQVPV